MEYPDDRTREGPGRGSARRIPTGKGEHHGRSEQVRGLCLSTPEGEGHDPAPAGRTPAPVRQGGEQVGAGGFT